MSTKPFALHLAWSTFDGGRGNSSWPIADPPPAIPIPPDKVRITIRLDRELVEHFRDLVRKAHRGNYQTLINDALREQLRKPGLAEVRAEVRSVLREEFGKIKATA